MAKRILKLWILSSFVIFVAVAASFMGAQQVLRQSANDPQVQMVGDTVSFLESGKSKVTDFNSNNKIDILKSSSPFITIFDKEGKVIASQATIGGDDLRLPNGILDYVARNGSDVFTWEPKPTYRFATIILPLGNGEFVLGGKNLFLVEKRIQNLTMQYAIGFAGAVFLDFVLILGLEIIFKEKRK